MQLPVRYKHNTKHNNNLLFVLLLFFTQQMQMAEVQYSDEH